jgi:hypothetical protein
MKRSICARVADAIEGNVAKPASTLTSLLRKPIPVGVGVAESCAIGLTDVALLHDRVMNTTPMRALVLVEQIVDLLGEPGAVTVTSACIKPVRIKISGQDCEGVEVLARSLTSPVKY